MRLVVSSIIYVLYMHLCTDTSMATTELDLLWQQPVHSTHPSPYTFDCPFMMWKWWCPFDLPPLYDVTEYNSIVRQTYENMTTVNVMFFYGDSISRQQFISLACSFHALDLVANYSINWGKTWAGPVNGGVHSGFFTAEVTLRNGVRLKSLNDNKWNANTILRQNLPQGSIVVASFYEHYDAYISPTNARRWVEDWMSFVSFAQKTSHQWQWVIREPHRRAEMVNNASVCGASAEDTLPIDCSVPYTWLVSRDEVVAQSTYTPIWISTYFQSLELYAYHPGKQPDIVRAIRGHGKYMSDCVHFCMPGFPDIWNLKMMKALNTVRAVRIAPTVQ